MLLNCTDVCHTLRVEWIIIYVSTWKEAEQGLHQVTIYRCLLNIGVLLNLCITAIVISGHASRMDQPLVWWGNIQWSMPSWNLKLKINLKVTQENKDRGACSNSVTICSEINVITCRDSVSLTKHAIARNALQILFNGLSKIYHIFQPKSRKTWIMDIHRPTLIF